MFVLTGRLHCTKIYTAYDWWLFHSSLHKYTWFWIYIYILDWIFKTCSFFVGQHVIWSSGSQTPGWAPKVGHQRFFTKRNQLKMVLVLVVNWASFVVIITVKLNLSPWKESYHSTTALSHSCSQTRSASDKQAPIYEHSFPGFSDVVGQSFQTFQFVCKLQHHLPTHVILFCWRKKKSKIQINVEF